jgi:hypothetical protein
MPATVVPEWKQVEGRKRCTDCGMGVTLAWVLFVTPTQYARVLCDDCVTRALDDGG